MNNWIELSTEETNNYPSKTTYVPYRKNTVLCSSSSVSASSIDRNSISDSESTVKSMSADSSSTTSVVSDDSLPLSITTNASYSVYPSHHSRTDSSTGKYKFPLIPTTTTTNPSEHCHGNSPSNEPKLISRKGILKHTQEAPIFVSRNDTINSPSSSSSSSSTVVASSTFPVTRSTFDAHRSNDTTYTPLSIIDDNDGYLDENTSNIIRYSHVLEEAGKHSPPPKHHHHHRHHTHENNEQDAGEEADEEQNNGNSKEVSKPELSADISSSSSSSCSSHPSMSKKPPLPLSPSSSSSRSPSHHHRQPSHPTLDTLHMVTDTTLHSSSVTSTLTTSSTNSSSSNGVRSVRIAAQPDVYVYTPKTLTSEPSDSETSPCVITAVTIATHHHQHLSTTCTVPQVLSASAVSFTEPLSFNDSSSSNSNNNLILFRQISDSSVESTSSTLSGLSESSHGTENSNGPPLGLRIRTRTSAHQELDVPSHENPWAVSPEKAGKPHYFNLRRSLSGLGRYSDEENDDIHNIGSISRSTSEPVSLPSRTSSTAVTIDSTSLSSHGSTLVSPPGKRHYTEAFFGPSTKRCSNDGEGTVTLDTVHHSASVSATSVSSHPYPKRRETDENSVHPSTENATAKGSLIITSPSFSSSADASSTGLTPNVRNIHVHP